MVLAAYLYTLYLRRDLGRLILGLGRGVELPSGIINNSRPQQQNV